MSAPEAKPKPDILFKIPLTVTKSGLRTFGTHAGCFMLGSALTFGITCYYVGKKIGYSN
jgi:hypothetical protein